MGIVTGGKAINEIDALFKFDEFLGNDSKEETKRIFENHVERGNDLDADTLINKEEMGSDKSDSRESGGEKDKTAEETVNDFKSSFANLNPSIVIGMFDVIVSRTFAMGTKALGGIECSYKDYALDDKEKKFLAPFVEVVVMDYIKTLKPRDVLIVALVIIYGGKAFDVISSNPKIKSKQKKQYDNRSENKEQESTGGENAVHNDGTIRYNKDGSIAKKRGPKTY